ncbi:amino acid/polyamine transporter I [Dichotomocladium elegans]|nr:amino acid/polyamine transporter I [Dichotomocladium elegans]
MATHRDYGCITDRPASSPSKDGIDGSQMLLSRLGYKQELQRTWSLFTTFGLSFANIGILSNTSATFQTVLQRGGPRTMILAWNLVSFFMICIALSLAEICSLYATSGGIYYWVFELLHAHPRHAPKAPFIAFATGWTYALANIISIGANNVIVGSLVEIVTGGTGLSTMEVMWIAMAVTVIHGILNAYHFKSLGALNRWNVIWSCGGLVVVIGVLSVFTKRKQSLEWVLTDYENQTGFTNPVYVFMLGMIGAAYSMFGAEGAAYANEETQDADVSAPMAIAMSIVASWAIGLAYMVILLVSIQDVYSIMNSSFGMPVAQLFWDAIGRHGTIGFLVLVIVCQFCTGAASVTSTSRMVFSLSRDEAAPDTLCQVNKRHLPANAVWFVVAATCVLVILPFPLSEFVFEILISATTITTHLAYAIVLGCRIAVQPYLKTRGRFSLGKFSQPVTIIAFAWTLVAVCIFTLPTMWPVEASNFNYSVVAFLGAILTTLIFWIGWGRKHYVGPRAGSDEETMTGLLS